VQFVAGGAKAGQSRHRLEGSEVADGKRALADAIHDEMLSIPRHFVIGRTGHGRGNFASNVAIRRHS
jgi:hypothetical protein